MYIETQIKIKNEIFNCTASLIKIVHVKKNNNNKDSKFFSIFLKNNNYLMWKIVINVKG